MSEFLIPIALSSQLDVSGEERIHAAKYTTPIRPKFYIITGHLPESCVGNSGTYQYTVVTGDGPAVVSISAGELPPGATMDENGLVTYTYTDDGTYSWTVHMVDAAGHTYDLEDSVVIDPMTLEGDLPDGYIDQLTYDELVLADNPIAWWKLGETSGTIAADSVGENPGTFQGAYILDHTQLRNGGGNGAHFTNNSSVYIPANPDLDFDATQPYSVEAWYRVGTRTSGGAGAYIYANSISPNYGYMNLALYLLDVSPTHASVYYTEAVSTTPRGATSTEDSPNGEIFHVAWTYDPVDGQKLYQNGVLVDTTDIIPGSLAMSPSNAHYIGGDPTYPNSYAWDGNLSDVVLYRSTLTPEGVAARYAAGVL